MVIKDICGNFHKPMPGDRVEIIGIDNVDGIIVSINWRKKKILIKTAYGEAQYSAVYLQLKK
jgi:hypothetical protein